MRPPITRNIASSLASSSPWLITTCGSCPLIALRLDTAHLTRMRPNSVFPILIRRVGLVGASSE